MTLDRIKLTEENTIILLRDFGESVLERVDSGCPHCVNEAVSNANAVLRRSRIPYYYELDSNSDKVFLRKREDKT